MNDGNEFKANHHNCCPLKQIYLRLKINNHNTFTLQQNQRQHKQASDV